jgi:hypothetical protein
LLGTRIARPQRDIVLKTMHESNAAVSVETEPATMPAEGVPTSKSGSRALEMVKWAFSFPAMLGTALVGVVFYGLRAFSVDPDLWWHIKTGQTILATHHWPTTDPYSFTVYGQPWIAFEWLGDCVIATASRIGGVRGLELLLIVAGSAIMLSLYALATMAAGDSKAGFVAAALLYPLAAGSFNMRSQMFGYVFLVLTVMALESFRRGKRWPIWLLPPLLLVWVNTHGSWIIGLGAIFVYWMCGLVRFRKRSIEAKPWTEVERRGISLVFLLSLIAVTITPYGTRLAVFPFSVASSLPVSVANILEWLPMPFNIVGGKIFLGLVLGFFLLQMAFDFTWRLEQVILFVGATVMACLHVRFVLLFVPFLAPLLGAMLARWVPRYSRAKDKFALNAVLMAGMVAIMIHYFPSRADLRKRVADQFPLKAVEYLRQHPVSGRMLDSYGFGGYLIWSMGPEHKVFIDGRSEIYERGGVLSDYMELTHMKPGGLDVLRRYRIGSCLLNRNEPLSVALAAMPDWQEIYSDTTSALFVRRNQTTRGDRHNGD